MQELMEIILKKGRDCWWGTGDKATTSLRSVATWQSSTCLSPTFLSKIATLSLAMTLGE